MEKSEVRLPRKGEGDAEVRINKAEGSIETLQLELIRFVRSTEVSDNYLSSCLLELEEIRDNIFRRTVYELSAYFYKVDEKPLNVPVDWWQHFKQRWYPQWALKRWPVKMFTYTPRALFLDETPPDKFTTGRVMYYFESSEVVK